MTKILVRIERYYEVHDAPFSRSYTWQPAYLTLECGCGERLTLAGSSSTPICRCGTDHSAIVRDIQEREGQLPHEVTHAWQHDTQEQAEQHLLNEDAYPEGSPWSYNDVTSRNIIDE
jgi:hypothetical protein